MIIQWFQTSTHIRPWPQLDINYTQQVSPRSSDAYLALISGQRKSRPHLGMVPSSSTVPTLSTDLIAGSEGPGNPGCMRACVESGAGACLSFGSWM
ncbi:unnamed protein product [Penicillium roqueforti FM164]|uniref:Genomic scaffold, ProqFM164S02 n=1 Tax=Penicillium roqueforti (strain FM164) TaxID=1365484 RepID=W6Q5X5_PENRF|nr:unnamed protein product [Penicillium roqueforti FM164]